MKHFIVLALCVSLSFFVGGCSDDDNDDNAKGSIILEFDNVVGEHDLVLNTEDEPYTNAAGESYKVTALKYYISNVKLTRADGFVYEDAMSQDGSKGYYLIDESNEDTHEVELANVPAGDYNAVTFTIGVDANKVTDGAQTGALDPVNGMFWSWNTGYVFLKVEGVSQNSSDENHLILYHVGGYTDPNNNIRTKTASMGDHVASVRSDVEPEVHMIIDVNKFFDSPTQISFKESPVRHMPAENKVVADNYINTFIVDHVHN